jgi:hypothetical protein
LSAIWLALETCLDTTTYAHRFCRFWSNLIPTTLINRLVERQFASRSPDQSVQDILELGRRAQLAQHNRAPGPHSVNIVGEPLKAFSTFVTLKQSDAYRSQAQSLVYSQLRKLEAPSLLERERAMDFLGGMFQCLTPPLNEASCLRLLGGSMELFQLTFLFGSRDSYGAKCHGAILRVFPAAVGGKIVRHLDIA